MRGLVLVVHIAAGSLGLALGPVLLVLAKRDRWRARAQAAYQVSVAVVCATALALVALRPQFWFLAPLAVGTEAAALTAWQVQRRRPPRWRAWHIRLLAGSYVALVTAIIAASVFSPVLWLLPTLVGAPVIEYAAARANRNRRVASRIGTGAVS
jgi:hypothetical protein